MSARRTLAALCCAGLLLAGCSDEPEPRFGPTESPSPSESETSAEPEAQTAEEFIREWVGLHTEMQNTGDTSAFREVSSSCKACIELADLVDAYYASGGFVRTDGWRLSALERTSASGDALTFEGFIRSAKTVLAKSGNSSTETLPAGLGTERFVVKEVESEWQMIDISEVAR